MGVYDIVTVDAHCPFCGHPQQWRVQYKYGDCRLHERRLGNKIEWSDPPGRVAPRRDYGRQLAGWVRTDGITENACVSCAHEGIEAVVYVKDDVIMRVELREEFLDLGEEGFRPIPEIDS